MFLNLEYILRPIQLIRLPKKLKIRPTKIDKKIEVIKAFIPYTG